MMRRWRCPGTSGCSGIGTICTDYAVNLAQLPTIAYAGEIDPQKQSSDIMMSAMAAEGLELDRTDRPKDQARL